jgi:hypothetical protein
MDIRDDDSRPMRAMSRDTEWIVNALSTQIRLEAKNCLATMVDEPDSPALRPGRETTRTRAKCSKVDFVNMETDVIRCICANIHYHIQKSEDEHYIPPAKYSVLNKEEVTKGPIDPLSYSLEAIQFIFTIIHQESQMEYECIVIALIYLERLQKWTDGEFRICPANWRFAIFGCMMLASKMFDDFSMINADYATIFHNFSLEMINRVELAILHMLDFSTCVSEAQYNRMHGVVQAQNAAAQTGVDAQMIAELAVELPPSNSMDDYVHSTDMSLGHDFDSADYEEWLTSGQDNTAFSHFSDSQCITDSASDLDLGSGESATCVSEAQKESLPDRLLRGFIGHMPSLGRLARIGRIKSAGKVHMDSGSETGSGSEEDGTARSSTTERSSRRMMWSRQRTVSPMPASDGEGEYEGDDSY